MEIFEFKERLLGAMLEYGSNRATLADKEVLQLLCPTKNDGYAYARENVEDLVEMYECHPASSLLQDRRVAFAKATLAITSGDLEGAIYHLQDIAQYNIPETRRLRGLIVEWEDARAIS